MVFAPSASDFLFLGDLGFTLSNCGEPQLHVTCVQKFSSFS